MLEITSENGKQILLVLAGCAARVQLLEWISLFACRGKVRVIDGGNQFNIYQIAKHIRRQTSNLHEALQRIQIARSFSCYQMTELLQNADPTAEPLFILDFLSSYYDENIRLEESKRLLDKSLTALQHLSLHSALIIGARPPTHTPERNIFLEGVKDIATMLLEAEDSRKQQTRLQLLPWVENIH